MTKTKTSLNKSSEEECKAYEQMSDDEKRRKFTLIKEANATLKSLETFMYFAEKF